MQDFPADGLQLENRIRFPSRIDQQIAVGCAHLDVFDGCLRQCFQPRPQLVNIDIKLKLANGFLV